MRFLLRRVFGQIVRSGKLTVIDWDGKSWSVGEEGPGPLILRFHDRHVALDLLRNPQLAFGEAYMDGRLTVQGGSIANVLELFARNLGTSAGGGYLAWIAKLRFLLRRAMQRNGFSQARSNVAHHYDLSGRLYDLFLDEDKQYSCAFFEKPTDTLEDAQLAKKRRIASKLALRPGQRVLDIGSGWGGLALHLARTAQADVTGITLSEEQLAASTARAGEADLSERVRFRLQDYRAVPETFDRIVSVGMFEHVGVGNYATFFARISSLLEDDGVALIHSIGRSDGPGVTNPWIAKYIFPGGYTPALSEVLPAVERAGLIVTDVEVWRLHYAQTLAEWRRRFTMNWEHARRLYGERFCRMWEFYLAGAEMGFRHQGLMVFQLQVAKRVDALPITRDYMTPAARAEAIGRVGREGIRQAS